MADQTRRGMDDEEFVDVGEGEPGLPHDDERGIGDDSERGVGEDEDDFEDEEADESDEEDEDDLDAEGVVEDRGFTAEIGSEGGSHGDIETGRRRPGVMEGSEATTTANPDARPGFDDRRAGGGVGAPRR